MSGKTVIEFKDVCFAYETDEILHNISLNIEEKNMVALVGPNGAGKSTVIKLTLGLLKPLRGKITVFGTTPNNACSKIGYVPQSLLYDSEFPVSVLDVVLMGRADKILFGPYRKRDKDASMEALKNVNMGNFYKRGFNQLSGGERQRVLIAQALVSNPAALLLDEPTANVDSAVEHEIFDLLHRLNENITVVIASHNLNVVTKYATHIICVNRTATMTKISDMTVEDIGTHIFNDMKILQHKHTCQVLDSSDLMKEPHHAQLDREEK